jgi:hypothetical protein
MMLVLEDDGCLHAYKSPEAVVLAVEALDAEECLRTVFDDLGRRYRIDWIQPNRAGLLGGVSNGLYRLVAEGEPDPSALLNLVCGHSVAEGSEGAVREIRDMYRESPDRR